MIHKNKIKELINIISSGYDPEKIILFGSYASGNANDDSDLDLFIIKDTDLPRPMRTVEVRKLLYGAGVPMDIVVYTPSEIESEKNKQYSFIHDVLNSGKTLYEK